MNNELSRKLDKYKTVFKEIVIHGKDIEDIIGKDFEYEQDQNAIMVCLWDLTFNYEGDDVSARSENIKYIRLAAQLEKRFIIMKGYSVLLLIDLINLIPFPEILKLFRKIYEDGEMRVIFKINEESTILQKLSLLRLFNLILIKVPRIDTSNLCIDTELFPENPAIFRSWILTILGNTFGLFDKSGLNLNGQRNPIPTGVAFDEFRYVLYKRLTSSPSASTLMKLLEKAQDHSTSSKDSKTDNPSKLVECFDNSELFNTESLLATILSITDINDLNNIKNKDYLEKLITLATSLVSIHCSSHPEVVLEDILTDEKIWQKWKQDGCPRKPSTVNHEIASHPNPIAPLIFPKEMFSLSQDTVSKYDSTSEYPDLTNEYSLDLGIPKNIDQEINNNDDATSIWKVTRIKQLFPIP